MLFLVVASLIPTSLLKYELPFGWNNIHTTMEFTDMFFGLHIKSSQHAHRSTPL